MRVPFARSLAGLFSIRRRMRADWDLRARRNAMYYIDCGHGESEASFWRSGEEDITNFVLRDIELSLEAEALEIGCGIGRLMRPLSARIARVTGVDISGEMVRLGSEALAGRPNARFLRTEGDLAGIPDSSLDFVYSHIVFQHVPSKKAILRYWDETARTLKAEGLFRFQVDGRPGAVFVPDSWRGVRWSGSEVRRELESRGFEVLDLTGEATQYLWVTARRRGGDGRPRTTAARFRGQPWNAAALDRLLERLGSDPAVDLPRILSGEASLRGIAEGFIAERRTAPARDYVTAVYRALLDREPDAGGLDFYSGEIEQGIARTNVVDCLLASAEFAAKHRRPAL